VAGEPRCDWVVVVTLGGERRCPKPAYLVGPDGRRFCGYHGAKAVRDGIRGIRLIEPVQPTIGL
jgi:hypothetical protein